MLPANLGVTPPVWQPVLSARATISGVSGTYYKEIAAMEMTVEDKSVLGRMVG